MSEPQASGTIERRYRRLLGWYPAGHRRAHEDEMLGVLLSAAREGQRWPRPGEAANLIWGALEIRLRPAPAGARLASWRDALAVFSLAVPLVMLVRTGTAELIEWTARPAPTVSPVETGLILLLQGQAVLAVLVVLRLRVAAAVVALGMAAFFAGAMAVTGVFGASAAEFNLLVLLLEAAALAASAGPRRGLELVTGWRRLMFVPAGVALGTLQVARYWFGPAPVIRAAALAVIAILLAGLAVASPLSRRVLLLLLIPGVPCAYMIATVGDRAFRGTSGVFGSASGGYLAGLYLVPGLVASLVAVSVLRARRYRMPGGAPPA
jgi:hypothetical protein